MLEYFAQSSCNSFFLRALLTVISGKHYSNETVTRLHMKFSFMRLFVQVFEAFAAARHQHISGAKREEESWAVIERLFSYISYNGPAGVLESELTCIRVRNHWSPIQTICTNIRARNHSNPNTICTDIRVRNHLSPKAICTNIRALNNSSPKTICTNIRARNHSSPKTICTDIREWTTRLWPWESGIKTYGLLFSFG